MEKRKLITIYFLLLAVFTFAQSGVNCNDAITQNPVTNCSPKNRLLGSGQQELWLHVEAIPNDTSNIAVRWTNTTSQFIQAKVYQYNGSCNSMTLIKDVDLLAPASNSVEFVSFSGEQYMICLSRDSSDNAETSVGVCVEKNLFYWGLCWNSTNSSGITDYFDSNGLGHWDGTVGYIAPDSSLLDGYGIHINLCLGDTLCVHGVLEEPANNYTPDCADLSFPLDNWWYAPGTNYSSSLPQGESFFYHPTVTNQLCMVYDSVGVFPVYYLDDTVGTSPAYTWSSVPTGFFVEVDDTAAFEPEMYFEDTICGNLGALQNEAIFHLSNFYPSPQGTTGETHLFDPFINIYIDGQYASSGQFPNSLHYGINGTVNLLHPSSDVLDSLNSIADTYGNHSLTVEIVPQSGCRPPQSFTYDFVILEPYVFEHTINCNEVTITNVGCQPIPESGANFYVNWGDGNNDNVTGVNSVTYYYDSIGTYDIIVQGAASGEFETITVTIQSVPNQNVSIHGNTTVCCLNNLVYSAPPGYLTYNWSIVGGTITNALVNEATVDWNTPFSGGQLTVTTTDIYNCTSTGTIYIDTCNLTPGPGPEIEGPDMKCCTTANVYTVSGNYSDFNWTVPDGVIVVDNGNSITVDWNSQSNNSIITVTMQDENCLMVTSTLIVEECCKVDLSPNGAQAYDTYFNTDYCAPTLISSIITTLPGGVPVYSSGDAILINHDLIIDQDFEFATCPYMYVMKGHQIYVMPGVRFTLNNDCVIRPMCDEPWTGIIVDDANSLVTINGTRIIGAEIALSSSNDAKYDIDQSDFYNNRIGISVSNYTLPTVNSIDDSEFGEFSAEVNVFGLRPTHGIIVKNVAELIVGENNELFNMDFGIHVTNSNVDCYKNNFYDFTPAQGGFNDGIAVYGTTTKGSPGNLLIVGDNFQNRNFFDNCHVGIYVENRMGLIARYNTMDEILFTGIASRKSSSAFLDIKRNNIRLEPGFSVGIYLQGMLNVTAEVQYNKINLTSINGVGAFVAGIAFDQVTVGTINSVKCTNNSIRQCAYGVYANQVSGIEIKRNGIQFFNNGLYSNLVYGIYAAGCTAAEIESNNVKRFIGTPNNNNPDETLIGIHAENSPQVSIFNNKVSKFGKGIQAKGNNSNSEMFCNRMTKTYNGIYLLNADVGNQGDPTVNQDNKWVNNVEDKISGDAQLVNAWYYRNGNIHSPYPNLVSNNPPIFVNNNSAQSVCPQPGFPRPPVIILPRSQQRKQQFDPIVYNEKTYPTYDTTLRYLDKIYAMTAFDEDATWLTVGDTSDATYQNYFTQEEAGDLGKICHIATAYKTEDYLTLDSENNGLNGGVCNYAKGLQDVNAIYLDTWASGIFEFDASQLARLEELACSDALENGVAVYSARTLLGWGYQCTNGYIKSSTTVPVDENVNVIDQETSFLVYPSPSEGEVYLAYDLGNYEDATLQVFDIRGQLVMNVQLSAETLAIQLPSENLNSGMYLYSVSNNGRSLANGKFIIK